MTLTKRSQTVIFWFVLAVIIMFITAFLWYVKFPFDTVNDSELSFGAVHAVFNVFMVIVFGVFVILGFIHMDADNAINPITIKKRYFAIPIFALLIILFGGFILSPYQSMKEMYNQHIEYVNQYQKIEYERRSFFDKMWKIYLQKHNICELNKEAFITVTQVIMEGRHDGEQVTWKWLQENQKIPYDQFTRLYFDLSTFVHEQRDSYYELEKQAMDVVKRNNIMLDIFPNNIYNRFLGIEHMTFEPGFTSAYTNKVFSEKEENLDILK